MRSITRKALGTMAVALVGSLLTVAPAEAHTGDPGSHVYGHRCRVTDRAVNNENTVQALMELRAIPGAKCEIDAYRISDGTIIVWHDATWNRVADPASLQRAGLEPRDRIVNATAAQVSQVRTRGGQPVPTLQDMIRASGQYNVPLVVDIRNAIRNEAALVTLANQVGANVDYYELVRASCSTAHTDRFSRQGADTGLKFLGDCTMTPAQIAAKGADFTQELSFRLTDAYLADMANRGIAVGILDRGMTETNAEALHARGIMRFLLDDPLVARTWFDGPG
jgi:glycerophosphoryl diester phosphodiesterase